MQTPPTDPLYDASHLDESTKKKKVDATNASGTQALTLRGLSNPGVLHMDGEKKKLT